MANTYLQRTLGTPTSEKIWTFSAWVKRSGLSSTQHIFSLDSGSNRDAFSFDSDNGLRFYCNGSATGYADLSTNRVLKDTAAWYHLVLAVDTSQGTAADRVKLYINGTQYTWDETTTYPSQDYLTFTDSGDIFRIGRDRTDANYFDGLMSHVHFCDGTQLAPTVFGSTDSTTGEWKINTSPSFTPGNNGFTVLKDGSTITDQSANSNDFSLGGGTLTQTEDCPSNNFCNLNGNTQYSGTMSNGNLKIVQSGYNYNDRGTLGMESGKFYWELKISNTHGEFGVCENGKAPQTDPQSGVGCYFLYNNGNTTGYIFNNVSSGSSSTITCTAFASGMIINVAYDADNQALYVGQNGTWLNSGDPTSGASKTGALITNLYARYGGTIVPFIGHGTSSFTGTTEANFGNGYFGTTQISSEGTNASGIGKFEYDVPTGYTALSTKGLNE